MPREYKPVTIFTPGGNASQQDRDFSPTYEKVADAPSEPGNPTADQMVQRESTPTFDEADPKAPEVVTPVQLETPDKPEKPALVKPPAK